MLCILYVNIIGTCLGIAGFLVERVLPATSPRRWVWVLVIAITMTVPGIYQANHTASVIDALEHQAVGNVFGATSLSVFDPEWWASTASYSDVITRGWLTASALLIIWGVANALRVSLLLRRSRMQHEKAENIASVDGVPVLVTDSLGPATVGLWRSRVLIPQWVLALPGVQRRYVLRHEDEHRKAHDARLLMLASLTLILTPWNLALWWQLRRLRLAVEMDCDNRVVSALGNAREYGALLLRVAEATSRGPRLQPALLGGMGSLERRLRLLLAPEPLKHIQRLLLPAIACVLLFIVLSMPHPVLRSHAHASTTSNSTK